MQDKPMPVDFRSEIIKPLLKTLGAGESCSLVGVGSSGKSNVIRHLVRPGVRDHYLGESARGILFLYTDCTKLSDYSIRALHGLILEAMLRASAEAGSELAALRPKLERLWEQATDSESSDRTRRALEEAVASTLQAGTSQIVVILDDFDHVVREAPAPVLNSLRALRDNYKYRVMYVTVTRRELGFLRNENEYQDLHELVTSTTIAIGPYRDVDANLMIERLSLRWDMSKKLNDTEQQRLLELSGGHAGLLGAILRAMQQDEMLSLLSTDLVQRLHGHKDIEPECAKIWDSLEEVEQGDLVALASQGWPSDEGKRPLERKGLIRSRLDDTFDIFSPLFADFVRGRLPKGRFPIDLVEELHQVKMGERVIDNLGFVEYQLFACLYRHRGWAVARSELIREMLRAERGVRVNERPFGSPEKRLDSYMAGIKRETDTPKQRYVIHEPDGSYRLINPDGS